MMKMLNVYYVKIKIKLNVEAEMTLDLNMDIGEKMKIPQKY